MAARRPEADICHVKASVRNPWLQPRHLKQVVPECLEPKLACNSDARQTAIFDEVTSYGRPTNARFIALLDVGRPVFAIRAGSSPFRASWQCRR